MFAKKQTQGKEATSKKTSGRAKRELTGAWKHIVWVTGLLMTLSHIYFLVIAPSNPWIIYCCHFGFGYSLVFMTRPAHKKAPLDRVPIYDIFLILLNVFIAIYIVTDIDGIVNRSGVNPTLMDQILFPILGLMVLEVARRIIGPILPGIAVIALLYARFGNYIPGIMGHRGQSWQKIFSYLCSTDGIFSSPFNASATMVFLFIVFGAFLSLSGSGEYFIDLSLSLAGDKRGGPAKVAVISSALFGTVSGNSVANVVSTGTLTIPMMKASGYRSHFAGATEAVASTGGQFMPPVLGSAAFIMAEMIGVSYISIVQASIIPALLYFLTVFLMVDLEAVRYNLHGMDRAALPSRRAVVKRLYLTLPLIVLIVVLSVFMWSTVRAALLGIAVCVAVSMLEKGNRITPKKFLDGLSNGAVSATSVIAACGTAGIVIGMLNLTGIGMKFASAIMQISQGSLIVALVMTMLACLVMGMGLPTAASYILCASVATPILIQLGVDKLAAHMFIFFFACISAFTPPVCTAAYAAAGIAKAPPMKVAVTACKIGCTAFIIPFMFVYGPALLLQGSIGMIALSIATAILGCSFLSFAIQGCVFRYRVNIFMRLLMGVAAICLIISGVKTDIVGLVLGAVSIIVTCVVQKRVITFDESTDESAQGTAQELEAASENQVSG